MALRDVNGFIHAARAAQALKLRDDDLLDTGLRSPVLDRATRRLLRPPRRLRSTIHTSSSTRHPSATCARRWKPSIVLKSSAATAELPKPPHGAGDGRAAGGRQRRRVRDVAADWRADAVSTWAAALRDAARAGGGVSLPDGRFVGPLAIEALVDAHLPPTLAKLRPPADAATPPGDDEDEDAPLYARLGLSASLCGDDAPLAHKLAAAGAAALDAELQTRRRTRRCSAPCSRASPSPPTLLPPRRERRRARRRRPGGVAPAHRRGAPRRAAARLLDGGAFSTSCAPRLLRRRNARRAAAAADDWSGDEEGPASAFAMLDLSAGLFEEA